MGLLDLDNKSLKPVWVDDKTMMEKLIRKSDGEGLLVNKYIYIYMKNSLFLSEFLMLQKYCDSKKEKRVKQRFFYIS